MTTRSQWTHVFGVLAVVSMVAAWPAVSAAQESKSEALVKELAQLLDQYKLDSIAARVPDTPDQFVGALYFPGLQMLVVTARYSAPSYVLEKLGKKEYREVYIDLNSASVPESKVFFEDLKADGMKAAREENDPYDMYEGKGKKLSFDGDWKKAGLSEQQYRDEFVAVDAHYSRLLTILIAQAKKAG
jgi:hypothetical protein